VRDQASSGHYIATYIVRDMSVVKLGIKELIVAHVLCHTYYQRNVSGHYIVNSSILLVASSQIPRNRSTPIGKPFTVF
jgi:hypothetical protein